MMIGVFVLITLGVVLLVRWLPRRYGVGESSLEILKRRYARGEISRDDFQAMRKALEE